MIVSLNKAIVLGVVASLLGVGVVLGLKMLTVMEAVGPVEAEATYGPIRLTLRLDKTVFELGETVNFTVTITNISNETVALGYLDTSEMEFAVYNSSSDVIFNSTIAYGAMGALTCLVLGTSESHGHTYEWAQEAGDFYTQQPVGPGTYCITGLTGRGLWYLGSADEYALPTSNNFHGIITVETPKIEIQIL